VYQIGRGYKRSEGHERTQLKYAFFGILLFFSGGVLFFVSLYFPSLATGTFIWKLIYSVILAYTIVRAPVDGYSPSSFPARPFEYSLITGVLAAVYIGVVTASTYVLERLLHTGSGWPRSRRQSL